MVLFVLNKGNIVGHIGNCGWGLTQLLPKTSMQQLVLCPHTPHVFVLSNIIILLIFILYKYLYSLKFLHNLIIFQFLKKLKKKWLCGKRTRTPPRPRPRPRLCMWWHVSKFWTSARLSRRKTASLKGISQCT